MISIIICSKNNQLSDSLESNIQNTIGCEYEIIAIDNSQNRYSIFAAYNLGIKKSKFPYLCFVHEDVEFVTGYWGKRVIDHLNKKDAGIIGVAGGKAALRVPYDWAAYHPMYNIIQSDLTSDGKRIDEIKIQPEIPQNNSESCLVLDGVFLCGRRTVFDKIQFDENLEGFHCYDADICLQSNSAGFQNSIVYDIVLKHFSRGSFDKNYINKLLIFHKKWNHLLPIFDNSVQQETIKKILYKTEKNIMRRLKKRMVRTGMGNNEIYPVMRDFIISTRKKSFSPELYTLHLHLHLIRFTSIFRKKMIYQKK